MTIRKKPGWPPAVVALVLAAWFGLCAAAAWFLYLRADLRTRGYRTRRLRFVFGSLFLLVSFAIWSLGP